ncbi:UDP-N-acetylmuramoyl-L-alanyl-D-glutamate--2,6-diaminopimelate ligase, partial [bacterium]|nr:UDP-N-acetylmuramoyl-L-alanyl-D-glutamate--2,6-diaminopimelate ligase [bacterium]
MNLGEIVKTMEPLAVDGSLDREITGIAYDSRRVLPGHLFVAMRGERRDGHRFLQAAIERGAAAAVLERETTAQPRVTRIRVADSRRSLALAAARFFEYPSQQLRVVGVTGTNGKT